jgi:hypothetical protein
LGSAFTKVVEISEVAMVISINVRGNMDRVIADLGRIQREVINVAAPRALNKMADQVKVGAAREMRSAGYNLKIGDIKKGLKVGRATGSSLVATVTASGRPIPLIGYSARQTAKGVSVNVLKGRKVINHAFIATMPNGHKGVFIRPGKQHKRVSKNGKLIWSGLAIKELFGPSVPDGLANAAVQAMLQRLVEEKFPEILRQQIKRLTQ